MRTPPERSAFSHLAIGTVVDNGTTGVPLTSQEDP